MFFALLHNNYDAIQKGDCDANEVFDATANPFEDLPSSSEKASSSTASCGLGHLPVRLQDVPGYDGSAQQWCVVCGVKITFCCGACSSKDYIVAIHPRRNKNKCYTCIDEHAADPSAHVGVRPQVQKPKKKRSGESPDSPARNTRQRTNTRAPRTSSSKRPAPRGRIDSDDDDDDDEDGGEEDEEDNYSWGDDGDDDD